MTSKDARAIYRQCAEDYRRVVGAEAPPAVRHQLLAGALSALGVVRLTGPELDLSREGDRLASVVSRGDFESVLTNVGISKLENRLKDFVQLSEQNGDDVTLIEAEDEEVLAAEEGRRLLMERDDIECLLDGVQVLAERQPSLRRVIKEPLERWHASLRRLDKRWKPKIRHFVPFNALRQAFRKARWPAERFWWWHLQSDCDLQAVYGSAEGVEMPVHISNCETCRIHLQERQAVLATLRSARGQAQAHPEADTLVRVFSGETSGEEERWVEWHVPTCDACRADMEALQRAEEAESPAEEGRIANERSGADEGIQQRISRDVAEMPAVSRPVLYRFSLAKGAGAAFVADTEDEVAGLPGRRIYRDRNLDVWMKDENGRIIVRVYGEREIDATSVLVVSVQHTGRQLPVNVIVREPKKHEIDIGAADELAGKRLSLVFGTAADRTPLGIVEFIREQ